MSLSLEENQAVLEKLERYNEHPVNLDYGIKAHRSLFNNNYTEEADEIAEELESKFGGCAKLLIHLGQCCLNNPDRSVELYKEALQLEPENEVASISLSEVYIKCGKPEAAWAVIESMLDKKQSVNINILYSLASAFREENDLQRMRDMLNLISVLDNGDTDESSDSGFSPSQSATKVNREESDVLITPFFRHIGFTLGLTVFIFVAVLGFNKSLELFFGSDIELYIVNGFDHEMILQIEDHEELKIPRNSYSSINISIGHYTADYTVGRLSSKLEFGIKSSLKESIYRDHVHVLNPARAAVVFSETFDGEEKSKEAGPRRDYILDKQYMTLSRADYLFTPFPYYLNHVADNAEPKTRISVLNGTCLDALKVFRQNVISPLEIAQFAENHMMAGHNESILKEYLALVDSYQMYDRSLDFMKILSLSNPNIKEIEQAYSALNRKVKRQNSVVLRSK